MLIQLYKQILVIMYLSEQVIVINSENGIKAEEKYVTEV